MLYVTVENLKPRKLEIVLVEPTRGVSTRTDSSWNLYWIELSRELQLEFLEYYALSYVTFSLN